nr:hypothetical protein [Tanacetum cinerariifolium]
PGQKVQNDDQYDVFAIECQHTLQSESVHKTYLIEQDAHNVIIESVDMNYDSEQIDQNDEDADLTKERELLASLIEKLKCEIDETKNRNTLLEASNKVLVAKSKSELEDFKNKNKSLKEANNKLSEENDLLYADFKKSKAELKRRDSIEYASEMELECAKEREMQTKLSAHQDTISILKQQKDAQIMLYKSQEDKELEKVIDLENKVKAKLNGLYDLFVPQREKSSEQRFFQKDQELSREYYYADHMNAILGVYTELDEDLKAQLQDNGIVISELKKLIEKLKGKSVNTKFEKSLVIRQPNGFKSPRPSVLGKPTTFLNSFIRKDFSKSTSVTENNVSNDFSKPVTAQTLPTNKKPCLKNTNVFAPGMYKLHTYHT